MSRGLEFWETESRSYQIFSSDPHLLPEGYDDDFCLLWFIFFIHSPYGPYFHQLMELHVLSFHLLFLKKNP